MSPVPPLSRPELERLGTRIYPLDLRADEELWIVSDLHLQPEEPEDLRAFAAFLARVPDGAALLILGDLFEYWSGPKQVGDPEWQETFGLFRTASERGVRIWILHGNRDFLLGRGFERATATRIVPGGLLVARPGAEPLLCVHGDELCLNDHEYQRSKKLLRSWWLRALSHVLPYRVCKRIAGGLRAKSKATVREKMSTDKMRPSRRAFAALADVECGALLYGHVHLAAKDPWPGDDRGRRYHVLPAFSAEHQGYVRCAGSDLVLYEGDRPAEWPNDIALGD